MEKRKHLKQVDTSEDLFISMKENASAIVDIFSGIAFNPCVSVCRLGVKGR